jgi:hypothetical protein
MHKQVTVAILLLALICQTFSRCLVMAGFYVNRDYIANNLCENRNRPQMHCNGKCQLKKQLSEEDRKDQENPERKSENKNEIFCNDLLSENLRPSFIWIDNALKTPACIGKPVDRPETVFRPPLA